ncbi:open rectifier potassium channel protein 1 isoform X1 [Neocloeon triangulifer]|uniref:open rectifier potassium channel protein 1 isoform X1 n=1 Tax=Neocloeon triangulifer TaxID=2078957 RepID=UPI00286F4894|nr:open rectifier potassium channel protein 1 isoform X1 [Neocloeon triangulifer]
MHAVMSRLEWLLLFLVFVVYVVLGGVVLMHLEGQNELAQRAQDEQNARQLQDLVQRTLVNGSAERLQTLHKVAEYCGKALLPQNTSLDEEKSLKWDFYNSFFVAVTIVSTIGYGNMAPTTFGTRMFCIGYALVGIPLNGILLAGLGEYFSRTFLRAHHRYKEEPRGRCQLLLKVVQYLAAGIALFILLPAVLFALAESWSYEEAVYYAFITLSTIGFGDYVAGFMTNQEDWRHKEGLLGAYRAFIVLWIMFGLGYLAMILSFITRAMRSSRLRRLEQRLARRIKSARLWNTGEIGYLRRVLNELYLLKFKVHGRPAVSRSACSRQNKKAAYLKCSNSSGSPSRTISCASESSYLVSRQASSRRTDLSHLATHLSYLLQPVYRERRSLAAVPAQRGRSCSLTLEGLQPQRPPPRSLSESCLDLIDRDATFAATPRKVDASELLATVAAAAAAVEEQEAGAHHGLPDEDILADERPPSASSRRPSLLSRLSGGSRKSSTPPSRRGSLVPSRRGSMLPTSGMTSAAPSRRGSLINGDARRTRGRSSLRRVLAERNMSANSQQSSPIQERRPSISGFDAATRRMSEGFVLRSPSEEPFSELDGTTVGDLLRALHALHSRRGSLRPSLTFEDEVNGGVTTRPDDNDDDWDGKSVQISRL